MTQRRLLMVTYHFPPSSAVGGHRLLGFCRHLPSLGWSCSVVAPPGLPWEPVDPELTRRVPAETSVYYACFPDGWAYKPVRWCAGWASWFPWAWPALRRAIREHRPDAVLTS